MGEKKRILLVDDDPAVTELLELRLDNWFEVIVTNDPRDVLPLARAKQPHAVICDIDMPDMDGVSLAEALHVSPRPFLVAVMIAGSAAFATPFGYQTNVLVYQIGRYNYLDFVKVGLPLNLITWAAAVIAITIFFPF